MRMIFLFITIFLGYLAYHYWKETGRDTAFIIMHSYAAALCVIGYLEFSK